MTDLIVTEALGSAIQQHEDDIERYRLLIAQRAQHEGPQAILSLVYGWHVAAGIVQALRQVATPTALHPPLARSTGKNH